jgi:hypothetical protein
MVDKLVDCKKQNNLEICDCDCHKPGFDIKHITPCCSPCPFCGERIKGNLEFHKRNCHKNPKK